MSVRRRIALLCSDLFAGEVDSPSLITYACGSIGRASDSKSEGWGFESLRACSVFGTDLSEGVIKSSLGWFSIG